ncbi:MAG: hypothetical protein H8M99_09165 [Gloeobacteraceae cyanobacterium ES-bin-144]|nr:hypothetical protein [Verrucomicrobiales bacterium]
MRSETKGLIEPSGDFPRWQSPGFSNGTTDSRQETLRAICMVRSLYIRENSLHFQQIHPAREWRSSLAAASESLILDLPISVKASFHQHSAKPQAARHPLKTPPPQIN